LATRGTVTSFDTEGGLDGLQVDTDFFGQIHVSIRADGVGGPGRLLVMTNRADQESRGVANYTFTGSTTKPKVVDFGPSGFSDLPPPRFAARFDKPMNPSTIPTGAELRGNLSGLVPGTAHYDSKHRTLVFVPDSLIDPANQRYTVSICACVTDVWGNQPDAVFEWTFGAVSDATPPTAICRGESENIFSPDGDGNRDTTEIRANLSDDTGLALWRVEIFSPEGLLVRTLVAEQTQNQNDVPMVWDGHDESGLLVNNARYRYRITAVDAAGNVSASCENDVEVDSVLDPAMFP
jgi:hypothetical protein